MIFVGSKSYIGVEGDYIEVECQWPVRIPSKDENTQRTFMAKCMYKKDGCSNMALHQG